MDQQKTTMVCGKNGLRGTVALSPDEARGSRRVPIQLEQDGQIWVPAELLEPQPDGRFSISLGPDDVPRYRCSAAAEEVIALPVAEEKLRVDRRKVETGKVIVTKAVREHDEVVDLPLVKAEVEVEHVPINRPVEGAVEIRQEGETIIIPLVEEILIVEKKQILREEVRITRRRTVTHQNQHVKLRKEEAHVERRQE